MDYTYKELSEKTAAELKEIASKIEHEAVRGYTQLNKPHLIEAICKALGIDMHEHHRAVGIDKTKIKAQIRALKADREAAIEAKDYAKLKAVRSEIKKLKKKLRKAMV
jgi:protein-arginine kinase activator protein McsA